MSPGPAQYDFTTSEIRLKYASWHKHHNPTFNREKVEFNSDALKLKKYIPGPGKYDQDALSLRSSHMFGFTKTPRRTLFDNHDRDKAMPGPGEYK